MATTKFLHPDYTFFIDEEQEERSEYFRHKFVIEGFCAQTALVITRGNMLRTATIVFVKTQKTGKFNRVLNGPLRHAIDYLI